MSNLAFDLIALAQRVDADATALDIAGDWHTAHALIRHAEQIRKAARMIESLGEKLKGPAEIDDKRGSDE